MGQFIRQSSLPDLFDKALVFGGRTHSRVDIAEGVKTGRYQYFGDDKVAVVTEILEYPQSRRLHVLLAAGDFNRMVEKYLPLLKSFAKDNECEAITTSARRGFLRKLPKVGWKPTHIAFELKLEGH